MHLTFRSLNDDRIGTAWKAVFDHGWAGWKEWYMINPVLAHFIDRPADLAIAQAPGAMLQSYIFHINGLLAGGNGYSRVIDPAGQILHDGNVQEEMIPIEVDFDLVRRQRERGLNNMGQVLKSFRDRKVNFDVYSEGFDHSYLNGLGALEQPARASLPEKKHIKKPVLKLAI